MQLLLVPRFIMLIEFLEKEETGTLNFIEYSGILRVSDRSLAQVILFLFLTATEVHLSEAGLLKR